MRVQLEKPLAELMAQQREVKHAVSYFIGASLAISKLFLLAKSKRREAFKTKAESIRYG
jgi:hypothetical protein